MSKNNIRKIKCSGNCIKDGETTLHPTNLVIMGNSHKNKKYCPTNHYIEEKRIHECFDNPTLQDLINHMRGPDLNLDVNEILSFYEITNIDSLIVWIDNNLENKDYNTVNRILNLWIKNNLSKLKNFNAVLTKTIKKIIIYHFEEINVKRIDKELEKYIDYWVKKKSIEDFYFNLIHDFKKYLNKKYDK